MKNLILTMVMLLSLTAIAQPSKGDHHQKRVANDMTVEQIATLKTKKMALVLDLTAKQQKEVLKVNLEEVEFRKAKMAERKENREDGEHKKLSTDEKFEMQNAILDRKIAQQKKLKEILTDEQFDLWKKAQNRKGMHSKKKMQKAGRRG